MVPKVHTKLLHSKSVQIEDKPLEVKQPEQAFINNELKQLVYLLKARSNDLQPLKIPKTINT